METCPHCGAPGAFDDANGADDGRCSICGMALPSQREAAEAVAAAAETALLPSAKGGTLQPGDYQSAATDNDAPASETGSDSDEAAPDGHELIKPRKLSPAFERHVTAIWHQTHQHYKNPQETIKSEHSGIVEYGTLHVGDRVVGELHKPGTKDYELSEVIGEGAMGVVWSARQTSLDRHVAIKMPKGAAANSESGRQQFMSEVVVTGQLDHPNIVPIYDLAKDKNGRLFYSMKRVEGRAWNELLDEGSLSLQANLEILMKVCDAIRFAHDRGVIHRDIKPHNIMVGQYGEVSVMDWGIALRLDASNSHPAMAKISPAGTPAYMAPEMATGSVGEIGPHTDVYLLGAVLYQLLAGEPPHPPPFDSQSRIELLSEALLIAARNVITPIEKHDELAEIAYRAMATDTSSRLQSVKEFQDAIREYLSHAESIKLTVRGEELLRKAQSNGRATNGARGRRFDDFDRARYALAEAIEIWPGNHKAEQLHAETLIAYANYTYNEQAYARGISLLSREKPEHRDLLKKLESADRRSKNQVLLLRAAAAAIFLIVAGSAFFLYQAWGAAEEQRLLAVKAQKQAEENETKALKQEEIAKENADEADRQAKIAKANEDIAIKQQMLAKENEERALEQERIARENFEEAERQRMLAEANEKVAERNAELAQRSSYAFEIGLAAEDVQRNAFDSAAKILESQSENPAKSGLRDWEWGYLNALANPDTNPFSNGNQEIQDRVESTTVSANREWVAAGTGSGNVLVWRFDAPDKPIQLSYAGSVKDIAILADGSKLFAAGVGDDGNHTVDVWSLPPQPGAAPERQLKITDAAAINSLDLSSDGRLLLAADAVGRLLVWDTAGADAPPKIARTGTEKSINEATFSPDDKWIVTAGQDGTLRVWDSSFTANVDGVVPEPAPLNLPEKPLRTATFSPDGNFVLAGGDNRRISFYPFDAEQAKAGFSRREALVDRLSSGPTVAVSTGSNTLGEHDSAITSMSFSDDGNTLFTAGQDHTVRVWDIAAGPDSAKLAKVLRGHGGWVQSCFALPGDNNQVLSAGYDGRVQIWNWKDYQFPHVLRAQDEQALGLSRLTQGAISPDGRWIATASENGLVTVWDMQQPLNPKQKILIEGHDWQATSAAYFDQGRRLLTAGGDNTALVWDTRRGNELLRIGGWRNAEKGSGWRGVADVSQSGRYIATGADGDTLARVWNANTGKMVAEIAGADAAANGAEAPEATAIAFSTDDQLLCIGDQFGGCLIVNTNDGSIFSQFRGHESKINAARFLPETHRLLTASTDAKVILWDLSTAKPTAISTFQHGDRVVAMALSADGQELLTATGSADETAVLRLWQIRDASQPSQQLSLTALLGQTPPSDPQDRPLLRSVSMHQTESRAVVTLFNPRESRAPYSVGIWNWENENQPYEPLSQSRDVATALYSPGEDSGILTVGGRGARLRPVAQFASAVTMSYRPQTSVNAMVFSADGRQLVCGGGDGTLKVWTVDDQGEWKGNNDDDKLVDGHASAITSVVFHPLRNDIMLSVSRDGITKLWKKGDEGWQIDAALDQIAQAGAVHQAIFVQLDGDTSIATVGEAGLKFWDLAAKSLPLALAESDKSGCCIAASTDGRLIAMADGSNTWVWDTSNPATAPLQLEGHSLEVTGLAFLPDGRRLFTSSRDSSVRVWNLESIRQGNDNNADSDRELLTLEGHTDEVTSVTVANSPDRPFVLTTGLDGQAIVWPSTPIEREE